jgi:hypothetical protein
MWKKEDIIKLLFELWQPIAASEDEIILAGWNPAYLFHAKY